MACVRESPVARAAIWVAVLGLVGETALGREMTLVVRPQKISTEAGKYVLLPPAALRTEGDAVAWYKKAIQALPDGGRSDQIQQWLKMPLEQLPVDEVEKVLTQHVEGFKCVAQAVKCRECKWPAWAPEAALANPEGYTKLRSPIRLWARYEIAQENYEGAVLAMQTGFGMSAHLTQGTILVQFLTGVSIAAAMCAEAGEFTQAREAPNLYAALAALPKPFTDVEKAIEIDKKAALSSGQLTVQQIESQASKASFDRVRILANRLDTDLAALQCVEAIRSYAASHVGQLPQTLAEIKEVPVPNDPASGAAFRYTRIVSRAVLESATSTGDQKEALRCEIVMKDGEGPGGKN